MKFKRKSKQKLNWLIKNYTPYVGNIYLKFEKFPYYTRGFDCLNKVHLDLKFTKLVSRMQYTTKEKCFFDHDNEHTFDFFSIAILKDGFKESIIENTGGYINEKNGFYSQLTHKYIGNERTANRYLKENLYVSDKQPCGCAVKLNKPFTLFNVREIIGYVGFSHRASKTFKLGDKLFIEPHTKEEYERVSNLPYGEWGYKTIENLDECEQAAINFSKYIS